MEISPIACFRSPVGGKFGLPRQAGLASSLRGEVVLESGFASPEALRGLEGFDYIWLIWGFSLNRPDSSGHLTVRPPRLGGNTRVGVFASRSPYRPNPLGLSSVRIESIDFDRGIISVLGADLADGTPIYDIKPYVEYADSHTAVRCGFTDGNQWQRLEVIIPDSLSGEFAEGQMEALRELLAEDPRPRYQDDPLRLYGLKFEGSDVRFKVCGNILTVVEIV